MAEIEAVDWTRTITRRSSDIASTSGGGGQTIFLMPAFHLLQIGQFLVALSLLLQICHVLTGLCPVFVLVDFWLVL